VADIFAEVASVGIQGLSSGGTVYVVPGATGSTGPQGVQGASGIGASGVSGSSGAQGQAGATGIQGPTGGASGPQGASGISGASGYIGSDGATGATGTQGASGIGFTGATGSQGASGATGTQGASGVGLTGATGASGPAGADGASGVGGASGYIGRDGASGIPGTTGAQGLTGATGTAGEQGATGVGIIQTLTFTTSSTDETIIDVIDTTTARSIKYEMQETSDSSYNASELRLLNSNENVFLTQYAGIGAPLGVFDTYFSPVNNNYSSPDINSGMSYWNGTTLRIYTSNNIVIQALLSAAGSTEMTLNSSAYTITLATAFTEVSTGIYQATTVESHSPLQLISNIAWTGTGFCELRYTPNNAVTTLKYQKTEIEV